MQTKDSTVVVAVSTDWDYVIGMNLYMDGNPVTACANTEQRKGWLDALYFDGIEYPVACADPNELDELYAEMHAAAREVDRVQGERTDWRA